jgi:hypothetical protein
MSRLRVMEYVHSIAMTVIVRLLTAMGFAKMLKFPAILIVQMKGILTAMESVLRVLLFIVNLKI